MIIIQTVEVMGSFLNTVLSNDDGTLLWHITVDNRNKRYMLKRMEHTFIRGVDEYRALPIPGMVYCTDQELHLGIAIKPIVAYCTKEQLSFDPEQFGVFSKMLAVTEHVLNEQLRIDDLPSSLSDKALYTKLVGNMGDGCDYTVHFTPDVSEELEAAMSYYQIL
jgi:hypothetical protein